MGEYNNSFCRICGTPYHRCNCKSENSWRKVTDTAEHYKIFCVIRDYNNGVIDADKANELLGKLDLSGKNDFKEKVKEVLKEIADKKKPVDTGVERRAKQMANTITGNGNGKGKNNTKAWK